MIYSNLPDDPTFINTFGIYHPWRDGQNPNWDSFCDRIMDIKKQRPAGPAYFANELNQIFSNNDFTIVTVPSHNPANTTSGMKTLVKILCDGTNRVDGTECLIRHTFVPKAATGGARSIPIHLNSIRVENLNLITGREVLLLDDVTTTHSSLLACQQLLQQHNPKLVIAYALGQTAQNE
ncbi:phosphoribosyltransferase family protein [Spirosoma agri]|uniref:Phosphoribosyltransferase n=1 Tax=Spirosoma agri TaxID=1987381 RepID=A0A6M0IRF4_9BACT|nr:phosphoribosyltransferase family protein [Spirosoma agri]NEU70909.1 hypothetical protein [Spirosoma agri]